MPQTLQEVANVCSTEAVLPCTTRSTEARYVLVDPGSGPTRPCGACADRKVSRWESSFAGTPPTGHACVRAFCWSQQTTSVDIKETRDRVLHGGRHHPRTVDGYRSCRGPQLPDGCAFSSSNVRASPLSLCMYDCPVVSGVFWRFPPSLENY